MNRKIWGTLLLAFFFIYSYSTCGKTGVIAGKASSVDLLRLLPENPVMLFSLDARRFTEAPYFDEVFSGTPDKAGAQKVLGDYHEFIERTGIDPKRDIFFISLAMYRKLSGEPRMIGIVNLRYDKAKILKFLKEEGILLSKEKYRGSLIFLLEDSKEKKGKFPGDLNFVFLDDSNILFGAREFVKKSLDTIRGKGGNAFEGEAVRKHLAEMNTNVLLWMIMTEIPKELKKKLAENSRNNMVNLENAEGFHGFVDIQNQVLIGEMELTNPDEKSNQYIANLVNGIKGFAALGGNENPEITELVNSFDVNTTPRSVKLIFSIKGELIKRLSEKGKQE